MAATSSNQSGEGEIRRALVEADLLGCMIAVLGQLFCTTKIPAWLWFLSAEETIDDESSEEKMQRLVMRLEAQFGEAARLEAAIPQNLSGRGYVT